MIENFTAAAVPMCVREEGGPWLTIIGWWGPVGDLAPVVVERHGKPSKPRVLLGELEYSGNDYGVCGSITAEIDN